MSWPKADRTRLTRRATRARRRVQARGKVAQTVVGFFRDKGKTRPVTKSIGELKRKKVVENSHRFQKVKPAGADISQRLEDLLDQLNENQNSLDVLNEQRQTAKDLNQIALKKKEIQRIRHRIKQLH